MPVPSAHIPAAPPLGWSRRQCLLAALAAAGSARPGLLQADARGSGQPLRFPRDHGAHPESAIEWWYVTGYLHDGPSASPTSAPAPRYGFQLTFFRSRVAATQTMRSAFAAKQLVMAHAALTDLGRAKLSHAQRLERVSGKAEVDLASFSQTDTRLQLQDWSLERVGPHYRAQLHTPDWSLTLELQTSQPVLLQGDAGWSRKGRLPHYASHYYSVPHLLVRARLQQAGQEQTLPGRAWLDHEWSDALLAPEAVGWDWLGMNLQDGSALTAFRLRDRQGQAVWAGGSLRTASGRLTIFGPDDLQLTPTRNWQSPHSQARYPVQWRLNLRTQNIPESLRELTLEALLDDQELDSRRSTGTIYWEGLSALRSAQGEVLAYGYLEMTGYATALKLS
jgi:predicted secreted hydrolase